MIQNIFLSTGRVTVHPFTTADKIRAAPSSYFNENSASLGVSRSRDSSNPSRCNGRQSCRVCMCYLLNRNSSPWESQGSGKCNKPNGCYLLPPRPD